ncbi:MAG TPA: hypothetical protein VMU99_06870 [Acidimicrobiales bacterium]|nr:hypothetical protein [Acidimicrobiales bacterium]
MSLLMVTKEETTVRGVTDTGNAEFRVRDYFGGSSGRDTGSEAFVSEQCESATGARSYPVDQFQIALGISQTKHNQRVVFPLTLRYTDAFTAFGPIVGEEQPLWVYTCRAESTPLVSLLPIDSDQLNFRGIRNIFVDVSEVRSIHAYGNHGVHISNLILEEKDGLRAERIVADSRAGIDLPGTHGTSGQFVFVSKGSIWYGSKEYVFESLGWMRSGDATQYVKAGSAGAECIVMRFPYPPGQTIRLAS